MHRKSIKTDEVRGRVLRITTCALKMCPITFIFPEPCTAPEKAVVGKIFADEGKQEKRDKEQKAER